MMDKAPAAARAAPPETGQSTKKMSSRPNLMQGMKPIRSLFFRVSSSWHFWQGGLTLGIHRSLEAANMQPRDKSLLRRLWWILVIRDASCGALFGRPFRINLDLCDVEMFRPEDFQHDDCSPEFANHPRRLHYSLYQIHMARLSLILRRIVGERFGAARRSPDTVTSLANLNESLRLWSTKLPPEIRWDEKLDGTNPFALCLAILHSHHLILANIGQPAAGSPSLLGDSILCNAAGNSKLVALAARRIMTLAGIIVRKSMQLVMPQEAFPGIFLAEVVFLLAAAEQTARHVAAGERRPDQLPDHMA